MPWLETPMLCVPGRACSRAASTSVQRSLPLVVAPCPSVMESPRATMAAALGAASTSISASWYQWSTCFGSVRLAAPVRIAVNVVRSGPRAGMAGLARRRGIEMDRHGKIGERCNREVDGVGEEFSARRDGDVGLRRQTSVDGRLQDRWPQMPARRGARCGRK